MSTPTTQSLMNEQCRRVMTDLEAWAQMSRLSKLLEKSLRAVMNTPHFHDMPDEVQTQVLAALGEKTSRTAADFDSGDADPYTARP